MGTQPASGEQEQEGKGEQRLRGRAGGGGEDPRLWEEKQAGSEAAAG